MSYISQPKTSPYGIFSTDPTFFSHFLIKQERGEAIKEFIQRYKDTCLNTWEFRWQTFFNPQEARNIFFLVGLKNRWLAREVYALLLHFGTDCEFENTLIYLKAASSAAQTCRQYSRPGPSTNIRRERTTWDWAQNRPNTPVYQIELWRYNLLTGKAYTGPTPTNLPCFAPDYSSDEEDYLG